MKEVKDRVQVKVYMVNFLGLIREMDSSGVNFKWISQQSRDIHSSFYSVSIREYERRSDGFTVLDLELINNVWVVSHGGYNGRYDFEYVNDFDFELFHTYLNGLKMGLL